MHSLPHYQHPLLEHLLQPVNLHGHITITPSPEHSAEPTRRCTFYASGQTMTRLGHEDYTQRVFTALKVLGSTYSLRPHRYPLVISDLFTVSTVK